MTSLYDLTKWYILHCLTYVNIFESIKNKRKTARNEKEQFNLMHISVAMTTQLYFQVSNIRTFYQEWYKYNENVHEV